MEHDATPAQRALREALVELMLEKAFARIGVKELCGAAHVARSTFYAYYDNTDELLVEIEDVHISRIALMNQAVSDPHITTPEDMRFFDQTLAYIQEHQCDFFALLVANPDARFALKWKTEIKKHLRRRRSAQGAPPFSALTEEVASCAVVSAVAYYLENDAAVSPEEVHVVLFKALSALDS